MKSAQLNVSTFLATSGNGVNAIYPVPNGMTILGYTGSIAMAYPGKTTGFNEVLFIAAWFPAGPMPTTFPGAPSPIEIPSDADVGTPTLSNASGGSQATTTAATGGGNTFSSAILKTNAPAAANLPLGAMGLAIVIPAGGYIVLHLDGDAGGVGPTGQDPANVELQLTIFYQ